MRRATRWVADELDAMARCLGSIRVVFVLPDGGTDPAERAVCLSLAIAHLLDVVYDATGGAGTWFPFLEDALAWLAQAPGSREAYILVDLAAEMVAPLCTESMRPPSPDRHRTCDDLAGTVGLALLPAPGA